MDVARALFERALAIFERVLGPDHPHTAASRRWLPAAEADRQADATEKGPLPGALPPGLGGKANCLCQCRLTTSAEPGRGAAKQAPAPRSGSCWAGPA
jgi:hypothetical protein